jgi:hypothetical protein
MISLKEFIDFTGLLIAVISLISGAIKFISFFREKEIEPLYTCSNEEIEKLCADNLLQGNVDNYFFSKIDKASLRTSGNNPTHVFAWVKLKKFLVLKRKRQVFRINSNGERESVLLRKV